MNASKLAAGTPSGINIVQLKHQTVTKRILLAYLAYLNNPVHFLCQAPLRIEYILAIECKYVAH